MYEYHKKIFSVIFKMMEIFLILSIIGVYSKAPHYLNTLNIIARTYISIFLIMYFNPISKHKFTEFDRKIVFRAGIFLLLSTTLIQYLISSSPNEVNSKLYQFKFKQETEKKWIK